MSHMVGESGFGSPPSPFDALYEQIKGSDSVKARNSLFVGRVFETSEKGTKGLVDRLGAIELCR